MLVKDDWFRPKSYLHFDPRLSLSSRASVENFVSNPSLIAKHGFLPLVSFTRPKAAVVELPDGTRRIDKSKIRLVCYASHRDAQIYSFYSKKLSEQYELKLAEHHLQDSVIAFRKVKHADTGERMSNIHFAHEAFEEIRRRKNCKVYAFDVKKFFDSLDAKLLKRAWAQVLGLPMLPEDHYKIWRAITRFAHVDRQKVADVLNIGRTRKAQRELVVFCAVDQLRAIVKPHLQHGDLGIPQGTPISAMLANIYMLSFDIAVAAEIKKIGGIYYRYCDDILVIVPNDCKSDISTLIAFELSKQKLSLNPEKSEFAEFSEGIDRLHATRIIQYLGFVFDGKSTSIRPGSISKNRTKILNAVSLAKQTKRKYNRIRARKGQPLQQIYCKEIRNRFSHLGKRNFTSYGRRAATIMKSPTIDGQMKKFDAFINAEIAKAKIAKIRSPIEGAAGHAHSVFDSVADLNQSKLTAHD